MMHLIGMIKSLLHLPGPPLPDHDLNDNLPSLTSSGWWSSYVCPHCKNDGSFREQLAGICESCGQSTSLLSWHKAANRYIFRSGKWVKQRRLGRYNYLLDKNGIWVKSAPHLPAPWEIKRENPESD